MPRADPFGDTPGIAAILFTDMVGSTALRARLGEEQADRLRRIHDRLLAVRIEVHPRARPEVTPPPAKPTGIDYLGLVDARLAEATRRRISYAGLPERADGHGDAHRQPEEQPDDAGGPDEGPGDAHDDPGVQHGDVGHVDHHDTVDDAGRHDDAERHRDHGREQP